MSGQLPPEEVARMVWKDSYGKPVAWENTNIEPQDPCFQPLKLTTARWKNGQKAKTVDGLRVWKWQKILAHKNVQMSDFLYGTDTETGWCRCPGIEAIQCCLIVTFEAKVLGVDVDDWANFLRTTTGQLLKDRLPITRRGSHCHFGIDARLVPERAWPKQVMINSTDHIKSNGFLPCPGSTHYSGERYEPVLHADGNWHLIQATPWLIAAILADQVDEEARRGWEDSGRGGGSCSSPGLKTGGRRGGGGGGHDGEVAATVMSNIRRGMSKEQAHEQWLRVAIPREPADPFTRDDFERHYGSEVRGALHKVRTSEEEDYRIADACPRWLRKGLTR
jgi:hypothetical protein